MNESAPEQGREDVETKDARYEKCIVSFMDILGFRDLVSKSKAEDIFGAISLFKKVTDPPDFEDDYISEVMYESGALNPTYCQFISDAIVRVSAYERIPDENNGFIPRTNALQNELDDLLAAQISLVERRILVRGGISFGDVFIDREGNGPFFGPGLIRAYDLENEEAVYPRLIIDACLLEEFRNNPQLTQYGADEDEKKELFALLRTGEDGIVFIDYVRAAHTCMETYEKYVDFLFQHKDLILTNLEAVKNGKTRRKYIWLARYHNCVVEEWREEFDAEQNFTDNYHASNGDVVRLLSDDIKVRLEHLESYNPGAGPITETHRSLKR